MTFNFEIESELFIGIEELQKTYGFNINADGRKVKTKKCEKGVQIIADKEEILIKYSKKHLFFMGFSYVLENYDKTNFFIIEKDSTIENLGIMRDCARNAILCDNGIKKLLLNMSLLGYNYLELYVEDLMEIEDLPYMGNARGRYKQKEFKEYDEYAKIFGIELVPCIQTLAHLPNLFRHDAFANINDIYDILLIDENKTYEYIEKVIKFVSESFTSRKINIGMDEAHSMCMGAYLSKHGFEKNKGEAFLKHLYRVIDICKKYNFKPSMWSDMFFKTGYNLTIRPAYVGFEGKKFSEEFKKNIPQDITLIFWDYYHEKKEFYDDVFKKHFELTNNIAFAGGVWTWMGFAPANSWAEKVLTPAIESCMENNCKNFMLTSWGNDGGECSCFITMSTFLWTAEKIYSDEINIARLNNRCEKLFGNTYEEFKNLENANRTGINSIKEANEKGKVINPSKYLLYNDPLCGVLDSHCYKSLIEDFKRNAKELKKSRDKNGQFSYIFDSMYRLCYALIEKATLGIDLIEAYKNNDKNTLEYIAQERIPKCITRIKSFYKSYKKQWLNENKSYGFEVTDMRIGSILFRLKEASIKIKKYINKDLDSIEELEQERLPVCTFMNEGEDICYNYFPWNISGSLL